MPFDLECLYCGKKWQENYFTKYNYPRCSVCKDKNIKIKEIRDHEKVDYYEGCPPYENETKKQKDFDFEAVSESIHDPWESGD